MHFQISAFPQFIIVVSAYLIALVQVPT